MSVVVLHLSDLHLANESNPVLDRGAAIAKTVFPFLVRAEAVFVLFSGDIAYSGKTHEYNVALRLISAIDEALKREVGGIDVRFFCCPGNHDCDFSGDQSVRDVLIDNLTKTDVNDVSDEIIATCAGVQRAFFEFRDAVSETPSDDHILWSKHVTFVSTNKVVIDLVNVSWMSTLHERPALQFPVKRFQHYAEEIQHLRLTVLHHPLNWYAQGSYRPFRQLLRTVGDLVLSGHEHSLNSGENFDSETGMSAYLEGGVLFDPARVGSTFNVLELDVSSRSYRAHPHQWDGAQYAPIESDFSADFRPLRVGKSLSFAIAEDFESRLNDPGAQFSHPGAATVTLKDIFVYPDLQRLERDGEELAKQASSRELVEPSKVLKGALVRGDDQSGRSTLLRRLFLDHHGQGRVPILLDARRISNVSDRELKKLTVACVREQYGQASVIPFDQTARETKILLIDNLDQAKVSAALLGNAMEYFTSAFGGVVAIVGMTFELSNVLAKSGTAPLRSFDEFELLEFGYTRRYELASRWVAIGDGSRSSADDAIALIDRAERIMTEVLGKNLVPSYPLYLLTLLQSIEAGQQSTLQNSAYGYYYQYLITSKLAELRVLPEQYEEYFNYCSQLAWFFKSLGEREVELRHIQEFHQRYCHEFVAVDFAERLDQLIESRILHRHGDYISFRYPYAYYFFLGKYLADRIVEPEVRARVARYCADLSLRDSANTILFLAHHTRDPFVYECAIEALSREFPGSKVMELGLADVGMLAGLIDEAPQLVFDGGEVLENRKRLREAQDSVASELRDEDVTNEAEGDLSDAARLVTSLNRLIKTAGILGQVLRNHYGSLKRGAKKEILVHLFDGVLRGLGVVFDQFGKDKDLLIAEIKTILAGEQVREDERDAAARRVAFLIFEMLGYVFIRLAASHVSSEYLRDVIRDTVAERDTTAYQLIGLAVELDQGKNLSLESITRADRDFRSNIFAQRLVRLLAVRYMYMFRTNEREKQKLCEELGITMASQRRIDLQTKTTKLLERK